MTKEVLALVLAVLGGACGGGGEANGLGPRSPDGAPTTSGVTTSAPATSGSTWTAYEDVASGVAAELPCAAPDVAPIAGERGIISFTGKRVACSSPQGEYVLEYWSEIELSTTDVTEVENTVKAIVGSWLEGPQQAGQKLEAKRMVEGPAGWVSVEARFARAGETLIERHHLMLPRNVLFAVRSSRADRTTEERFVGSLRISEPGTSPSSPAAEATGTLREHALKLDADRFAVTLPCTPRADADGAGRDDTPLGPATSNSFACRHSHANVGFNVMLARFETPLAAGASAATRLEKSRAAAQMLARSACDGMQTQGIRCTVGFARQTGDLVDVDMTLGGENPMRVRARYPFAALVGVTGELPASEIDRVLDARLP